MGKIYMILGPSSSGKDSIMNELMEKNKLDLKKILLNTTRPRRTSEVDGKEYNFDTYEDMLKYKEEEKIVELRSYDTQYGTWYYYTVSESIDLENNNYITVNTLEGLDQYLKYYKKEDIFSILIQVDNGIRLQRALNRERVQENPKYDELCRRYLADSIDFSEENISKRPIDIIINNDGTFEEVYKNVEKYLSRQLRK